MKKQELVNIINEVIQEIKQEKTLVVFDGTSHYVKD